MSSRNIVRHHEFNFPADGPLKTLGSLVEIARWIPETVEYRQLAIRESELLTRCELIVDGAAQSRGAT